MFETNIQNNSTLVSLAKAAQITGYHQDYLGQLCRLGRLPAKKVGRNWFTTDEALRNFSTPLNEAIENEIIAPDLTHSVVVSQVEGLPISIRTRPAQVQNTNSVQIIANNMRIQALQREVMELRELLTRLMNEVAKHSQLLDGRSPMDLPRPQETLRHNYVSNFDFNPPRFNSPQLERPEQEPVVPIWVEPKQNYSVITWLAAAASLAALAYLGTAMATGMLFGQEPQARTVYYHEVNPAVAGVETSPQALETPMSGDSLLNVLQ